MPEPNKRVDASDRLGYASGAAFVVLAIVSSFFVPDGPERTTASATEIHSFLDENGTSLQIGAALALLSLGLFVVFVAVLCNGMRRVERMQGDQGDTGVVAFASGVVIGSLWFASFAMSALPLLGNLERADAGVTETIYVVSSWGNEVLGDATSLPRAIFAFAVAALALRQGVLPRWIAWFGVVVGVMCVIGTLFPLDVGLIGAAWFFGFIGFLLWLLATSITLTRRGGLIGAAG